MTPQFEIKKQILLLSKEWDDGFAMPDDEDVESVYDEGMGDWEFEDAKNEIRCSASNTNLTAPNSRHYEPDQVAMKMSSGNWVSWTYWTGGGKHSNPEEIDWISDAFYVDCVEEEKTVVVRTFRKPEQ